MAPGSPFIGAILINCLDCTGLVVARSGFREPSMYGGGLFRCVVNVRLNMAQSIQLILTTIVLFLVQKFFFIQTQILH